MRKRLLALLLAFAMTMSFFPALPAHAAGEAPAGDTMTADVVIANTTYAAGAWTGEAFHDTVTVPLTEGKATVMDAISAALTAGGLTADGVASNYIVSVTDNGGNTLASNDGGPASGWSILQNDWFINAGADSIQLADGDLVQLLYSVEGGPDLGGLWNNYDKTLSGLAFSAGTLDKTFDSATRAYTLTVPAGVTGVGVTPTAANKNYQVRAYLGTQESGKRYARTAQIPVTDGAVITVVCGDPSWPSLNNQAGGTAASVPGETYTVTIRQEAPTYGVTLRCFLTSLPKTNALTLTDASGASIAMGEPTDESNGNWYQYSLQLAEGMYTFAAGDGTDSFGSCTFQVEEDNTFSFSKTTVSSNMGFRAGVDYTLTLTGVYNDKEICTPAVAGDQYSVVHMLDRYTVTVIPADERKTEGYTISSKEQDLGLSESGYTLECGYSAPDTGDGSHVIFTLPAGATMTIGSKVKHYYPLTEVQPVAGYPKTEADGTVRYAFDLTDGVTYTYAVRAAGKAKYADSFKMAAGYLTSGVTVQSGQMADAGYLDRVLTNNSNHNTADVLLNLNAQGTLQLQPADTYQLHPLRIWQAVENTITSTNTPIVEPDYHYTVYNVTDSGVTAGDGSIVTVTDGGLVTGKASGVALVLVTYDALYEAKAGGLFSAIWPENTGVMVVQVGQQIGAVTNMTINAAKNAANQSSKREGDALDAELDTLYYLDGQPGAQYTFTPESGSTVTLLRPTVSETAMGYAGAFGTDGVGESNGTYTLTLTQGRNIVRVEKDGKTTYQVITAKKLGVTISNATSTDGSYHPGDRITIKLDTVYHPANKLAAINNFYAQVFYTASNNTNVSGSKKQYDFAAASAAQTLSFTIPTTWTGDTYSLTGGLVQVTGFGAAFGSHRDINWETGLGASMTALSRTAYFAALPDITLSINRENRVPVRKSSVPAAITAAAVDGGAYRLDLSGIFTDPDRDALTYLVEIDGGAAVSADQAFAQVFSVGEHTLRFVANDGKANSADDYTVTLTVKAAVSVQVTVLMQKENTFLLTPQTLTVSSNLAEQMGYPDSLSDSVSALDVLTAAHQQLLGDSYTAETAADYLAVSATSGMVTKVMGENTMAFSFAINGEYPCDKTGPYGTFGYTGYSFGQAAVATGDRVDFFYYQDTGYYDWFASFRQNGSPITTVTVTEKQSLSLTLFGFQFMNGGYSDADRDLYGYQGAIANARLALMDVETGELTPLNNVKTGEDGTAAVSFSAAGTYYLSAYTRYNDAYRYIVSPCLKVTVTEDHSGLTDLSVRTGTQTASLSNAILAGANTDGVAVFDRTTLTYDLGDVLQDSNTGLYFWYTVPETGTVVTLTWGESGSKVLSNGTSTSLTAARIYAACLSVGKNTLRLTVTPPAGSQNQEVTYQLQVNCLPTLTGLTLQAGGVVLTPDSAFTPANRSYILTLANTTKTVDVVAVPKNSDYQVTYNGQSAAQVDVSQIDQIVVAVTAGEGSAAVTGTYTIQLNKAAVYSAGFSVQPTDAIAALYDANGKLLMPENGVYTGLLEGCVYRWTVSRSGYVSQTGTISGSSQLTGGTVTVSLQKTEGGTPEQVGGDWPSFRGNDANNGVTAAASPRTQTEANLLWAAKLATDYTNAPSAQIIADGALIVMSGRTIKKMSLKTGEMLQSADMVSSPSYGYTPPVYADGVIICPLGGGVLQAFNAKTLESLWVYTDPLGGQALSPAVCSDGYVYTGFWNSETKDASFVCVSMTDEDPGSQNEAKIATWRDIKTGGFYWAGAVVVGDAVIYGGDNGASDDTSGGSTLQSRNKYTGAQISALPLIGDQRSAIAYGENRLWFTTKDSRLWRCDVDAASGALSGLTSQSYTQYGSQSTSTPVVYDGMVMLAVGDGMGNSTNQNIIGVRADTLELVWNAQMPGYPQCSLLLSTAYQQSGYLYLYATYNKAPGGMQVIRVKTGAAGNQDVEISTLYNAAGYEQYCISSVIAGADGTLYYKNDSGTIFAVNAQYAITAESAHGTVTVSDGTATVTAAPAGTALTAEVSANTGWKLQSLTLNGVALTVQNGKASFTMPAGNAVLKAQYVQDAASVPVREEAPTVTVGAQVPAQVADAVAEAAKQLKAEGLTTAADRFVRQLLEQYPNHTVAVSLSFRVQILAAEVKNGVITTLRMNLTPMYAIYLDGAETPAASGSIPNSSLSAPVTMTLSAPAGMTVSSATRVLHNGQVIVPQVGAGTLSFRTDSFSEYEIVANGQVAAVTYYLGGGSGAVADGQTVAYYLENVGSPLPVPSRSGYTFAGWFDAPTEQGVRYTAVASNLPARLYAVWKQAAVRVTFRLIGDGLHTGGVSDHDHYITYVPTTQYTMAKDTTMYDLFVQAMADAGLRYTGASGNYISTIYAPAVLGGYALSEFDNGKNSGWMYSVNGTHPSVGLKEYKLQDGDTVIWHYTDDYRLESAEQTSGNSQYLNRWLEAEDIAPQLYVTKMLGQIVTAGAHGKVLPALSLNQLGQRVTFTFTPDAGYQVKSVTVDGVNKGRITTYTYEKLTLQTRIKVEFETISGWSNPFTDVNAGDWFYDDVAYALQNGLFDGVSADRFAPQSNMTRAMLVTVLYRMAGSPAVSGKPAFSDAVSGAWYADALAWAASNRIVDGYGNGRFGVNDWITREQLAAVLYRYAQYRGYDVTASASLSGFTDAGRVSAWATPAMQWAYAKSLITGRGSGMLAPAGTATRAEAAALLHRFCETVTK